SRRATRRLHGGGPGTAHSAYRDGGVGRAGGAEHIVGRLAMNGWQARSATAITALLAACAPNVLLLPAAADADPIRAAFVVLGEGGVPVVRVVTTAPACPVVDVDGAPQPMKVRVAAATEALRPTLSTPQLSKPSAFPVLTCELTLTATASRATVGGHALPLLKRPPQRIVVIGDSGCRLKAADDIYQSCNDPEAWPFAQVIAAV